MRSTEPRRFNPFSLDAINFLLADARGALGPYLNVFLVTQQHWSQSEVGLVTTKTFVPCRIRHLAHPRRALHLLRQQLLADRCPTARWRRSRDLRRPYAPGDRRYHAGTGRYNLALGAIATMQGIGALLSGLAAGVIVDHFGYSAAFLTLGVAAGLALVVFALGMPETAKSETVLLQS
jgi:hypothetical protein